MSPRLALFFAVLALAAQLLCLTGAAATARPPFVDARPTPRSQFARRSVIDLALSLFKAAKGTLAAGTKGVDTLAAATTGSGRQAVRLHEAGKALLEAQNARPIGELGVALKQAQDDLLAPINAVHSGASGRAVVEAPVARVDAANKAVQAAQKRARLIEELDAGTKELDTLAATSPAKSSAQQAARLREAERALLEAQNATPIGELRAALKQAQDDLEAPFAALGIPGRGADVDVLVARVNAAKKAVAAANKAVEAAKNRRPISQLREAVKIERARLVRKELAEKQFALLQEALLFL